MNVFIGTLIIVGFLLLLFAFEYIVADKVATDILNEAIKKDTPEKRWGYLNRKLDRLVIEDTHINYLIIDIINHKLKKHGKYKF